MKVQEYLAKKKNKFLSDDLYDDDDNIGIEEQIHKVVLPLKKTSFNSNGKSSLCSKLWQFKEKTQNNSIPCLFIHKGRHS